MTKGKEILQYKVFLRYGKKGPLSHESDEKRVDVGFQAQCSAAITKQADRQTGGVCVSLDMDSLTAGAKE